MRASLFFPQYAFEVITCFDNCASCVCCHILCFVGAMWVQGDAAVRPEVLGSGFFFPLL